MKEEQKKNRGRGKQLLRGVLFLLVLAVVSIHVLGVFGVDASHAYENVRAFLNEKPNSLDAVFIGASTVHRFWLPLAAWAEHGISVWNYSVDHLPAAAIRYMMTESRKTQPNALYLVALNVFRKEDDEAKMSKIHRAADYMPLSLNKIRMVMKLSEDEDSTLLDKLEYIFPVIRFHTRWDSLEDWSFGEAKYDYKSSSHWSTFNKEVTDISGLYRTYGGTQPATEDMTAVLDDLLDYCDEQQVKVLFVKMPQVLEEDDQERLNDIQRQAAERGYPCVDLLQGAGDAQIDFSQDFYNTMHTNLHGALKVTDCLADYLEENYGLADKRGKAGWESWDSCAADYMNRYLAPYCLPFEISLDNRTAEDAPVLEEPWVEGREVSLSWWGAEWADGFEIFRKVKDEAWKSAGTAGKDDTVWSEDKLKKNTAYTYTVVPFREEGGRRIYGRFRVNGVDAKTGGK